MSISDKDVLDFLQSEGTDVASVRKRMEQKEKLNYVLEHHKAKIFVAGDGRYKTNVIVNGKRRIIARKEYDALIDKLYTVYEGKTDSDTLRGLFDDWIKHKETEGAASTYIRRLKGSWNTYYENDPIVDVPIADLTKLKISEWLHCLIPKVNRSRKAFNNVRMIMMQELDYAVDREIIKTNPGRLVKIKANRFIKKRKGDPKNEVFTQDEKNAFIEKCYEEMDHPKNTKNVLAPLAAAFQFYTGLRAGEVVAVKYSDIDGNILRVQRMWRSREKEMVDHLKAGYEFREFVIPSKALEVVKRAKAKQKELGVDSPFIFSVTDEPFCYDSLQVTYARICKELGINHKPSHKARKTHGSELIDGGMGFEAAREHLGHADVKTTTSHYYYNMQTKDEELRKMDQIFDG